jgi:hypothetical protein
MVQLGTNEKEPPMRTYWHGEGKITRISLPPLAMRDTTMPGNLPQLLAASLGFPSLLDWTNRLEQGDEVVVFGPSVAGTIAFVPGRDDLEADSLVVWMRRGAVAGLFFAKTVADLVAIMAMLATYEKALCDITEYRERFTEIRMRHAQEADDR